MLITNEAILALKPCLDRKKNYLKYYKDKSHTPRQFMGLKNITHQDKLWVAFRLVPKDKIRLAAADIAQTVLHLYETKYPGDMRPRRAIEASRENCVTPKIREDAADASAYAAAAAYAAAYAADAAGKAKGVLGKQNQEKLIRTILIKYLNWGYIYGNY